MSWPSSSVLPRATPDFAAMADDAALSPAQFDAVRRLMHRTTGIHLVPGKEGLVRSRLAPRLRTLGFPDVGSYLDYLDRDASGTELAQMVDLITTNKTSFFREPDHFDLLQREILPPKAAAGLPLRIWSAGCSSGEEAYTAAIVARETLPSVSTPARILATDVSTRVLHRARQASYRDQDLIDMPPSIVRRHFVRVPGQPGRRRVADATRALVRFARLNLIVDWPMHGPFDVILCRNVMIYFDRPTRQRLIRRFAALLAPGGWLLVGHSESLTALEHPLRYVRPAVYRRAP